MVNILVPTDFSNLSKVAARYAIKIANELDGTFTLLHVMNILKPVSQDMKRRLVLYEKEVLKEGEADMEKFAMQFARLIKFTKPMKTKVVESDQDFSEVVKKEAKKLRSGLIVMGTHGATGLKKVVMGSNTSDVISSSTIPVLAIPASAEYKGFRNIVYASDLRNILKELKQLIPYAKKFESTIHLVHIVSSGKSVPMTEEKIEGIIEKSGYENIVVMVLADSSVEKGIEQYIKNSRADILAMFTRDLNFYEKLFDRSITRRMAFHSKVPLLAFKQ
jgi:nucleotide-binding universal stress UspA family protein